jgi:hypothetical protein
LDSILKWEYKIGGWLQNRFIVVLLLDLIILINKEMKREVMGPLILRLLILNSLGIISVLLGMDQYLLMAIYLLSGITHLKDSQPYSTLIIYLWDQKCDYQLYLILTIIYILSFHFMLYYFFIFIYNFLSLFLICYQ